MFGTGLETICLTYISYGFPVQGLIGVIEHGMSGAEKPRSRVVEVSGSPIPRRVLEACPPQPASGSPNLLYVQLGIK